MKRFEPIIEISFYNSDYASMEEHPEGDYVLYSDVEMLISALKHCRDYDTSVGFGYEYSQEIKGHAPCPGQRFKTPKERAEEVLKEVGIDE